MTLRRLCLALAIVLSPVLARAGDRVEIPSPNGTMVAEVFRPSGPQPYPVVIFSHGRAGDPHDRATLTHPVSAEVARFWTSRGIAVVAPIRPGYGPTGGADVEDSGSAHCTRTPDFNRTATNAAKAIVATVDWVRDQPWAKKDRLLLQGQSVGGLGTVAAAARHPAGVIGYLNFAGGSGGDPKGSPGHSCRPELLGDVYRSLADASAPPGLWFYAANDEYWGPDAPKDWGKAYVSAGGKAKLIFTGPTADGKGHGLLRSSPQLWTAEVNRFLKAHGL